MTDQNPEQLPGDPSLQNYPPPPQQPEQQAYPSPQEQQGYPPPQAGLPGTPPPPDQQMQPYGYAPTGGQPGPVGQVRSTGIAILLWIVTLGIYGWYWYYKTHEEMKKHSGDGIGGGIALILAIFVGIVMPFINSSEVGNLYERAGREKPVSGATGLWAFPGCFIIVGPFIWFAKTNGALNRYWESLGAQS